MQARVEAERERARVRMRAERERAGRGPHAPDRAAHIERDEERIDVHCTAVSVPGSGGKRGEARTPADDEVERDVDV
jgi:hypothetical protein